MSTIRQQFEDFKTKFERKYENEDEEKKRFEIFKATVEKIEKHNDNYAKGLTTYEMGINHFADRESSEVCCNKGLK